MIEVSPEFRRFVAVVKKARRDKSLHSSVEERLLGLLVRLYPDSCPVREVTGVLGGRNDLIQFFRNGRRGVFELFASVSQVPQDLRLLEQSNADVRIAILLDQQINPKLAREYFRKKPNHFQYVWLSQVLMPERESKCLNQLREMIESQLASQPGISVGVFEKRLAAYNAVSGLLKDGYSSNLSDLDSHNRFQMRSYEFRQQKDAFVLTFGNHPTVVAYVDEVHEKCVDLSHVNYRLYLSNQPATGEERSELFQQEKNLHQWFYGQYCNGLRATFSKQLSLT